MKMNLPSLQPVVDLEWSTPGGGSPAAQTWREQSWSMQAELEEHITLLKVEPPTTSVYLTTLSTSAISQEFRDTLQSMELSLRLLVNHFHHFINTMSRVLCAMSRIDQSSS